MQVTPAPIHTHTVDDIYTLLQKWFLCDYFFTDYTRYAVNQLKEER